LLAVVWDIFGYLILFKHMSEIEENIEKCRQAVMENPEDVEALNSLGIAYWAVERDKDAAEVFTRAVEIDPELAGAWYNLGCVCKNAGREDRLEEIHLKLENLDKKLAKEFFKEVMKGGKKK